MRKRKKVNIVYKDKDIVVCEKPAGMPVSSDKTGDMDLWHQLKNQLFFEEGLDAEPEQAVLTGWLPQDEGTWRDFLKKDPETNCSCVVPEGTDGAKEAVLDYEVIDMMESSKMKFTYCLIHLRTGRHHQIRVQTSSRGFGIWGDTKYNPLFQKTKKTYREIGLYAARIAFVHPVSGKKMEFKSEPSGQAFELLEMEDF